MEATKEKTCIARKMKLVEEYAVEEMKDQDEEEQHRSVENGMEEEERARRKDDPETTGDIEVLREAYQKLKVKLEIMESEKRKRLVVKETSSITLATWMPYIKITFSSTLTALILFVVAERQYVSGSQVGFGVLSAIGGASLFLAIPATHWIGYHVHHGYKLFQPFRGGVRFVVLQALSWTFYSITALIVLASVAYAEHTNGLLASAGVIGILSQVFMISSLLTYSSSTGSPCGKNARRSGDSFVTEANKFYYPGLRRSRSTAKSIIDPVTTTCSTKSGLKDWGDSALVVDKSDQHQIVREFVQMNTGLVFIGVTLALVSERTQSTTHQPLFGVLSLLCCIVAIFLTYGIAGRIRNVENGWSFTQLFRGGKEFVLLQIAGWCLFGIALVTQGFFVASTIYVGTHIPGTMLIGGIAALLSQFVIVRSLRRFKPPAQDIKITPWNYRKLEELSFTEYWSSILMLAFFCNSQFVSFTCYMVMLCFPYMCPLIFQTVLDKYSFGIIPLLPNDKENFTHTFKVWWMLLSAIASWTFFYATLKNWGVRGWRLSLLLSTFAVCSFGGTLRYNEDSPHYPMLLLICSFNFVYISTTFTKKPESNACREWPELKNLPLISNMFAKFFGFQLHVTEECKKVSKMLGDETCADSKYRQVMLLFHPHSIFPISHVALSLTALWKEQFPHLKVNSLTASIIHFVPVMRDVLEWFGSCDVSKGTVNNLIRMGRNVQIVCGGQTEMFESRSWDTEITVVRKRRLGVFKIAIQQGLGVMPVYSFGETLTFDNLYMPRVQGFFKNMFGFPFPFVMLGKWGLPIPRRVPISVAVGEPVFPVCQNDNPSLEEIQEFHGRYFKALQELFDKYKGKCGHGECSIKWLDH